MNSHPLLRNIVLMIDYRRVFGRHPSLDEVLDVLRVFDPEQLLHFLSWISIVISKKDRGAAPGTQLMLMRLLFPDQWRQVQSAQDHAANTVGAKDCVIFCDAQILTAVKLAIMYARGVERPGTANFHRLGMALLKVNDINNTTSMDNNETMGIEKALLVEGTAMSTFYYSDERLHAIARSHLLFMEDRPHLKGISTYFDFPEACRQLLGVDPEGLWTVSFALFGRWDRDGTPTLSNDLGLDLQSYLAEFKFRPTQEAALVSWMVSDYEPLRSLCFSLYGHKNRTFDHVAFARGPLVRFGRRVYCPFPSLLKDRIGIGYYHLFLSKLLGKKDRDRFQSYTGEVFEDYAHQLMERIFPRSSHRYFRVKETALEQEPGKKCDGVLICGRDVILFEYKSKIRSVEARSGSSLSATEAWIDAAFVEPALQCDHTAEMITNSKLIAMGIRPDQILRYWPVFVSLESTPLLPTFDVMINDRIRIAKTGYPICGKLQPWQSMHVCELERLESAVQNGHSFHELIAEKQKVMGQVGSFRNHWHDRGFDFATRHNPFLQLEFDRMTRQAEAYCRSRGMG